MSTNNVMTRAHLFHRTTQRNAANILRLGFWDSSSRYMTNAEYSGVWLTSDPERVEGAKGDTQLVVNLDVGVDELDQFEWKTDGGTYREWLVPAEFLRAHITSLVVDEVLR